MSLEYPSVEWHLRRLTGEGVLSGVDSLKDTFSLFLVQCVIILSICRILGLLGSRFNQPQVIFEIIGMALVHQDPAVSLALNIIIAPLSGGILLGPSAIGRNQAYLTKIFPTSSLPLLSVVANLGLVLYLFIVGMELGQSFTTVDASCVSNSAITRSHQFLSNMIEIYFVLQIQNYLQLMRGKLELSHSQEWRFLSHQELESAKQCLTLYRFKSTDQ